MFWSRPTLAPVHRCRSFGLPAVFIYQEKHIPGLVEIKRHGNSPEAGHTKYEPAMFDIFPSVDTAVPVP